MTGQAAKASLEGGYGGQQITLRALPAPSYARGNVRPESALRLELDDDSLDLPPVLPNFTLNPAAAHEMLRSRLRAHAFIGREAVGAVLSTSAPFIERYLHGRVPRVEIYSRGIEIRFGVADDEPTTFRRIGRFGVAVASLYGAQAGAPVQVSIDRLDLRQFKSTIPLELQHPSDR